jgi:hypothetical protein
MTTVALLLNLIQDVAVLRPLAYLLADDLGWPPQLLITHGFRRRDRHGAWQAELDAIARDTGGRLAAVDSPWQLWRELEGRRGALVCGSESDLPNHQETHTLLQAAPPGFTRITLQHGHECVGFLLSRAHRRRHGSAAGSAADILCGWLPAEQLSDLRPQARARLVHTGPSLAITATSQRLLQAHHADPAGESPALVCENTHSVRFDTPGSSATASFLAALHDLAGALADQDLPLAIRPHPAGLWARAEAPALPGRVELVQEPSWRVAWNRFLYGVSAPSSVLFDLMLAGVPVGVWQGESRALDTDRLRPLPLLCNQEELLAFDRQQRLGSPSAPAAAPANEAFMRRHDLGDDPAEAFRRLFRSIAAGEGRERP